MKNEYIFGVHSPSEMTVNAFPSDAPSQANFCVTNSFPYAVGMPSIYNQPGSRPHYSTDQAKLHNHSPSFHPQSVPISCKGFVDNGLLTFDSLNLATVGFTAETKDKHLQYGLPLHHMFEGQYSLVLSRKLFFISLSVFLQFSCGKNMLYIKPFNTQQKRRYS